MYKSGADAVLFILLCFYNNCEFVWMFMCVLIFTVSIKLSIYVAMYYKNMGAKVMYLVRHNLIPMDNSQ